MSQQNISRRSLVAALGAAVPVAAVAAVPALAGTDPIFAAIGHFKDLTPEVLRLRVSGRELACDFLVSAPPVSGSCKPFPGVEGGDWFEGVGPQSHMKLSELGYEGLIQARGETNSTAADAH
jgi:hypothetical protein